MLAKGMAKLALLKSRALGTTLLLLAVPPLAICVGLLASALIGADHGPDISRYAGGALAGLIVGARHLAKA